MNILMGIVLIAAGAFGIIRNRDLVERITANTLWSHEVDESTSRENLLIVGGLMIVSGLVFLLL